jgi:nitrogen fixation NifU-like protein
MDRQAQIDFILDHYQNPRHYGPLPGAMAMETGVNPACGDRVTFYLQVGSAGRIAGISFTGEGCTISQAAASMITEMFAGKELRDVETASPDVVLGLIGPEIASTRLRCATLGLDTAKEAVRAVRRDTCDSDNV